MAETARTATLKTGAGSPGLLSALGLAGISMARLFAEAFEKEIALRRPFLWLPVAAGAGAVSYLYADREPSLWIIVPGAALFGALALVARGRRLAFAMFCALCAFFAGELSASWRSARAAAPVIGRVTIATVEGYIEQMDFRPVGARFILRVRSASGLAPDETPFRVRLSTRRAPPFEAGTYVRLKARLLPPARASLPDGYDFARDAWFARLGAVGSSLGRIESVADPPAPGLWLSAMMSLDRGRNALARRIYAIVGGDAGAIAAAMVTGKRDLLSDQAKETIREAGIFHIITISGVQMTLVAAIFFVGFRRLLALSSTLALRYPIKKWAAVLAMAGALFYDIATGSRVGTERALVMTLIMLSAVVLDRQALTMRNLAFAAAVVVLVEPEAITGASFQLSFAAVAALVAVYEARMEAKARDREDLRLFAARPLAPERSARGWTGAVQSLFDSAMAHMREGPLGLLFATFCATAATASFMAYNFHELSPYVLIGNPLTLTVIEIFAVPGAIAGALLYPLGLDAWVWRYVGLGIEAIMWAARVVGRLPGATIHLPAFAPWSIAFLTLAVLSAVLWRTAVFRAMAIPFAAIGLFGAAALPAFDLVVAPNGAAIAVRGADGRLAILGARPGLFTVEQWLRADADGRDARAAVFRESCDKIGCVGRLRDGRIVALVLDRLAFAEDCVRADLVVTPLFAPTGCAARVVIDRDRLKQTGALTIAFAPGGALVRAARSADEDRPWSRAPKRQWGRSAPPALDLAAVSGPTAGRKQAPDPGAPNLRDPGQEAANDSADAGEPDDGLLRE
ncbi:ComEC/Rec2 family competence protein [Methylocapsa palsarum]|uniref:Competence protein ComEC n=1 Tax=Methylocapsa palsarum TaxID=1612308 RepID=A0A1I3XT64_9HYPH|nr:ComEC/Rec2 family competence protein [Methylocapsa palsarum]SFK22710.1 competence protein ComEC [Methylocapsa palsarum]